MNLCRILSLLLDLLQVLGLQRVRGDDTRLHSRRTAETDDEATWDSVGIDCDLAAESFEDSKTCRPNANFCLDPDPSHPSRPALPELSKPPMPSHARLRSRPVHSRPVHSWPVALAPGLWASGLQCLISAQLLRNVFFHRRTFRECWSTKKSSGILEECSEPLDTGPIAPLLHR